MHGVRLDPIPPDVLAGAVRPAGLAAGAARPGSARGGDGAGPAGPVLPSFCGAAAVARVDSAQRYRPGIRFARRRTAVRVRRRRCRAERASNAAHGRRRASWPPSVVDPKAASRTAEEGAARARPSPVAPGDRRSVASRGLGSRQRRAAGAGVCAARAGRGTRRAGRARRSQGLRRADAAAKPRSSTWRSSAATRGSTSRDSTRRKASSGRRSPSPAGSATCRAAFRLRWRSAVACSGRGSTRMPGRCWCRPPAIPSDHISRSRCWRRPPELRWG